MFIEGLITGSFGVPSRISWLTDQLDHPVRNRPCIETTKQLAALRQIHAAIEHFQKQEFECVVTLAGAAEGLLPPTDAPHLFIGMKEGMSLQDEGPIDLNLVINWLKHSTPPDAVTVTEVETVIVLQRAITKFIAVHRKISRQMDEFLKWARDNGYPVPKPP
jgi:hypothetical protein